MHKEDLFSNLTPLDNLKEANTSFFSEPNSETLSSPTKFQSLGVNLEPSQDREIFYNQEPIQIEDESQSNELLDIEQRKKLLEKVEKSTKSNEITGINYSNPYNAIDGLKKQSITYWICPKCSSIRSQNFFSLSNMHLTNTPFGILGKVGCFKKKNACFLLLLPLVQ